MERAYHRRHSPSLGREMELLAFGRSGARVLAFPPRLGRFFDYENWGVVESLRRHVERGWIQLVCLDSVDDEGLYAGWRPPRERIERHDRHVRYAIDEALPFT